MINTKRYNPEELVGTGNTVYLSSEVDALLGFLGERHELVEEKLVASRKKLQARVKDNERLAAEVVELRKLHELL